MGMPRGAGAGPWPFVDPSKALGWQAASERFKGVPNVRNDIGEGPGSWRARRGESAMRRSCLLLALSSLAACSADPLGAEADAPVSVPPLGEDAIPGRDPRPQARALEHDGPLDSQPLDSPPGAPDTPVPRWTAQLAWMDVLLAWLPPPPTEPGTGNLSSQFVRRTCDSTQ
jgi:hypothetical protein